MRRCPDPKRKRRHSLFGPAIADHCADLVPRHVLRDQLRAGQVRPGLAAARIPAVTERAVLQKERLARFSQYGGIACGRGFFLPGERTARLGATHKPGVFDARLYCIQNGQGGGLQNKGRRLVLTKIGRWLLSAPGPSGSNVARDHDGHVHSGVVSHSDGRALTRCSGR